ncbi:MAG TPA: hypothetical protein VMA73_27880 [Streptosporangiaceae bacterium]|nr:hypothetical protein [Streptosporangiaceae bacterium]
MSDPSPPPPALPPPASNAASDRRFQTRIAVIGLVGGLLGALIGGGATLIATSQQRQADAVNQLRTERETAYLLYQNDIDTLYNDATNVAVDAEEQSKLMIGRVGPIAAVNMLPSITRDDTQLNLAADQVVLIGSPHVRQVVNEQQSLALELFDDAKQLAETISHPPPWPYSSDEAKAYLSDLDAGGPLWPELTRFQRGMVRYADVAAIDLGTNR